MKGFTLIELLTVVVIVGILASIALPQYQRAVEKSRAAEAMTIGKTIIDSQNRLLDAFPNDNAGTKGALDIILSGGTWDPNTKTSNTYKTQWFTYTLSNTGVSAARTGSNYNYTLTFYNQNSSASNTCSGDSICANMASLGFEAQ